MTHSLLGRQLARRLGATPAEIRSLGADELAARLSAAGPAVLAALLADVERAYGEADAHRKRLAHALTVGTAELFDAARSLEARAAQAEAHYAVVRAARDGGSLEDIVSACLAGLTSVLRWPVAYAWAAGEDEGGADAPLVRWHVDRTRLEELPPAAVRAIEACTREHCPLVEQPLRSLRQEAESTREPLWREIPPGPDPAAAGPRAALAIPVFEDGRLAMFLAAFTPLASPCDPLALDFARHFVLHLGGTLAHRRSERRRHTQHGLLDATLESTPDGVLVFDHDGRLLVANRRFSELWRIDAPVSSDGARLLASLLPRLRDPAAFARLAAAVAADRESVQTEEIELVDGQLFECHTQPMRVNGIAAGRLWVFRDRSAIRRARLERERLEEQYRQAQKMEAIGRLAGGVAHDFNNILTAILCWSEVLAERVRGETRAAEAVGEVRGAALRASELTRQLLAFGRKQVLAPVELDLNATAAGMRNLLDRLIGEDVRLTLRLGPRLGTVRADPAQLEQVILNLVVNARDAMPEGGEIDIQTRAVHIGPDEAAGGAPVPAGDWVVLSVRDTGTGMSEEVKAHVFEPFYTTKPAGRGTGLGLSTVYGIVEQSGGHVHVESAPGCGTTFLVFLPLAGQAARSAPPPSAEQAPAGPCTGTILLVEDEDSVRRLAASVLRGLGYQVLEAESGSAALRLVESRIEDVDLLLTDVVLPGMSGLKLHQRLAHMRPDLPVLFTSGYTDEVIARHGGPGPGPELLPKPYTRAGLAEAVRLALERPHLAAVPAQVR